MWKLFRITLSYSFFLSCSTFQTASYKRSIEQVIKQDKDYFAKSQREIKAGSTKLEALSKYVKSMRTIETSGCPNSFRTAFLSHIQAWEGVVSKMRENESTSLKRFFAGIFGLFVGQPQFAISAFLTELQADGVDTSQIDETWKLVEKEALEYDVIVKND